MQFFFWRGIWPALRAAGRDRGVVWEEDVCRHCIVLARKSAFVTAVLSLCGLCVCVCVCVCVCCRKMQANVQLVFHLVIAFIMVSTGTINTLAAK